MLTIPGSPPSPLVTIVAAIFLATSACQAEPPASTSASGAAGAAATGSGGPIEDPGAGGLRAGLQANGSIAYVRNK